MAVRAWVVAELVGFVQGVVEWLPISSEGGVSILLSVVGFSPALAVRLALFLHAGTAIAAIGYYRGDLYDLLRAAPYWRPAHAFRPDDAMFTFYAGATLVSGVVGIAAYVLLVDAATELAGGAFIAVIGVLLIVTGALQRAAGAVSLGDRDLPDALDAVLVGVGQGLAILPGISRSGTTTSVLLLRGHDGESAFQLSFILSIPAAFGASVLSVVDVGGLPGVDPMVAVVALAASAVVGYLTIDVLMRVVRRVAFWTVCAGLGALAIVGGGLVMVV